VEKRDKINIKNKNNFVDVFLNTINNSYIPTKRIKVKKNTSGTPPIIRR
tara:strand:+ start:163 stop:309 length:147 start_codon:yes stop_codon:yes gene_type:complete